MSLIIPCLPFRVGSSRLVVCGFNIAGGGVLCKFSGFLPLGVSLSGVRLYPFFWCWVLWVYPSFPFGLGGYILPSARSRVYSLSLSSFNSSVALWWLGALTSSGSLRACFQKLRTTDYISRLPRIVQGIAQLLPWLPFAGLLRPFRLLLAQSLRQFEGTGLSCQN